MRWLYSRPFLMLALTTLIMSSLMMISSSNWLFLWCGLEINLLSFIPLMMSSNKFQENEAATKYFLMQALGSSLILMSTTSMYFQYSNIQWSYITITAILLKLGMAPCHFWFPSVMSSLSWMNCLILSTWQKLGPLTILAFVLQSYCTPKIMIIIASINSIIGGLMGMNQSKIKSIMAYSSITHMGWMTSLLVIINPLATMIYYLMYVILLMPMFLMLHILSVNTQPQLQSACASHKLMTITMPLMILSISGMPPLSGFFPKMMTINILAPEYPMLLMILIIGAMMNMFFYLNLSFSIISAPNSTSNYIYGHSPNTISWALSTSSLILLIPLSLLIMYAMTLLN